MSNNFLSKIFLISKNEKKSNKNLDQIQIFNQTNPEFKNPIMKNPSYFQPDQSFTSLDYTFSFSKYSCISWMYPVHIIFAYLVVITGILAMLSRIVDRLRPYHSAFGRLYLIFMLWCMAASLLIYTVGLPFPILISFVYLLTSISVGWNAIKGHTNQLYTQVRSRINQRINSKNYDGNQREETLDIEKIEQEEKNKILKGKTLKQRLFSYKMLHGILMSFSWYQMAGRLMVTNPFTSWQGCWTYPAYKSDVMMDKVFPVDRVSTPAFPMDESAFLALITIPTVIIILVIAFFTTYWYYKIDLKSSNSNDEAHQTTITSKLTN